MIQREKIRIQCIDLGYTDRQMQSEKEIVEKVKAGGECIGIGGDFGLSPMAICLPSQAAGLPSQTFLTSFRCYL